MSDQENNFCRTFFTFIAGAVFGAGLALLFAPQSGEETRKKIKDLSVKVGRGTKEKYEQVSGGVQKAYGAVKSASQKVVGQVKEIVSGAKEVLTKDQEKSLPKTDKRK